MLNSITSPAQLKRLQPEQLPELAEEIREFLVKKVSATGGHMGPNLGVVELTIAMHYVFSSPDEPIIFDTSHQSYVHKILTGRAERFDTLRQKDGLSGYTSRAESEHDWTESSHASAALSYADGLSKGMSLTGRGGRNVVALVGDGALTGGMCWEALNNIAESDRNVVIIVNDNGRSYSPTVGGLGKHLSDVRMQHGYDELMEQGKRRLKQMGWVGERAFEALAAMKEGVKSQVLPTEMFSELGLKYVGPVNGHNLKDLCTALRYAKNFSGPILVHVVTEKGHGFAPAVNNQADQMHSTGVIDPITGEPTTVSNPGWTSAFSRYLLDAAAQRRDLVAITAAMAGPTGLQEFANRYPSRFFDVGIAEAHAMTSAAGLALAGLHPVVALYSTFMNRGFDQLLMDIGLLRLPVTIVLDRAGVTGSDGASHNGVWDMALGSIVPGLRIAAPRDGEQLRELFDEAIAVNDGPTIVRYPKGDLPAQMPALRRTDDGVDIVLATAPEEATIRILVVAMGVLPHRCLKALSLLDDRPYAVTVIDPRWVFPVAESVISLAAEHDLVIVAEDGIIRAGVGSAVAEALSTRNIDTPIRHLGFPQYYPQQASRGEILAEVGLDPESLAVSIDGWAMHVAQTRTSSA